DAIKELGKDEWSKLLREAKHAILFYAEKIKFAARDERDLAKKVKEELLPDLLVMDSEIEKEYFIKEVAGITGISPGNIYSDLKKINIKSLPQPTNETVQSRTKIPEENFADLEKEI